MIAVSKNVDLDKFDDIVNKYSNIYHTKTKMKTVDVRSGMNVDYSFENSEKDPKFKVGDRVRISKYKKYLKKDASKLVRKSLCY